MSLFPSYPAQAKLTVSGLAPAPGYAESPRQRGGLFVGVGVVVGVRVAVGVRLAVGVVVAVVVTVGVVSSVARLRTSCGCVMVAQRRRGIAMIAISRNNLNADDFMKYF